MFNQAANYTYYLCIRHTSCNDFLPMHKLSLVNFKLNAKLNISIIAKIDNAILINARLH